jgi:selenide,water dikinase
MTTLNARAADLLRRFEPRAVTDVTGFGLFGHAFELAGRSGVRLTLEADKLPALPGALEAAARDLRTGGDRRNREYVGESIDLDGTPDPIVSLGYDAQTSGGLLAAVPAERAAVLEATFHGEGLFVARVGQVEEGAGVRVL